APPSPPAWRRPFSGVRGSKPAWVIPPHPLSPRLFVTLQVVRSCRARGEGSQKGRSPGNGQPSRRRSGASAGSAVALPSPTAWERLMRSQTARAGGEGLGVRVQTDAKNSFRRLSEAAFADGKCGDGASQTDYGAYRVPNGAITVAHRASFQQEERSCIRF